MLFSNYRFRVEKNTVLFDDREVIVDQKSEYNVIFGRGVIDLTSYAEEQPTKRMEINVIFGEGVIKINPERPMKIKVNSAFAGTKLPDGNRVAMGEYTYQTPNYKDGDGGLEIFANVVFGSLAFLERAGSTTQH
jgi:hypothetical protein